MNCISIIEKKRDHKRLTKEEIAFFISGYVEGSIQDYQASAFLMAICINGMDELETFYLTQAMMNSGDIMDLSAIEGVKVDKHSTGGVGDKTSLTLAPMLAACGLKVAKMSGRGLSHTGGTLDKLEAISNFNINVSNDDFIQQVNDIGLAIIAQSDTLVPADKKLYALRDVCGCVPSIPLIASSVMSKKLAAGADYILLDVKYGDGAFMATKEEAEQLAKAMIDIGVKFNKKVKAEITSMQQPLGNAIGNTLEVKEAVETLLNKGPEDFTSICVQSCSTLLMMTNSAKTQDEAIQKAKQVLEDGSAYTCFLQMCEAQQGNVDEIKHLDILKQSLYIQNIYAETSGYLHRMHTKELGLCACDLGAGRKSKDDEIQFEVGLYLHKKCEDVVNKGDVLCSVHTNKPLDDSFIKRIQACFETSDTLSKIEPLIYKTI